MSRISWPQNVGCCSNDHVEGTLRHPSFWELCSSFRMPTCPKGIADRIRTDLSGTPFFKFIHLLITDWKGACLPKLSDVLFREVLDITSSRKNHDQKYALFKPNWMFWQKRPGIGLYLNWVIASPQKMRSAEASLHLRLNEFLCGLEMRIITCTVRFCFREQWPLTARTW